MGKHNHHTECSLLGKFIRRGTPLACKSFGINDTVKRAFDRKLVISICMDSPFYLDTPYDERKNLIARLTGK